MDGEVFTVRGSTGVDLELSIAGPGSRSYAFVIDWHIRVLLALAWLTAATLALNGGFNWRSPQGSSGVSVAFWIFLPAAIIYFLYHPILELLMRGQTPGKRKAGVRVVTRDGGIPSAGAILIRNVFRLIDSLPAFYLVGLISSFVSAQRLRIGDMAAGTLLVMEDKAVGRIFSNLNQANERAGRDYMAADLAAQLLERWPALEAEKRAAIARALLQRIGSPQRIDRISAMNDAALKAELVSIAGIKI
jgi:uncharacterized RDD family membrane protein YckC